MIPRHSLPFGIAGILSFLFPLSKDPHPRDLEKACEDALGVSDVILLPSVRAGILMTVRSVAQPGAAVVGPAYTCETVHQALALSGARTRLLDSGAGSFLMSPGDIGGASEPGWSLVLSELYGIPYDLAMVERACSQRPRLRILDLAMCIPSHERMQTLGAEDVALFSFGWGKPMYAGWGGIACIQDRGLAGVVRDMRDRWTRAESPGPALRRDASVLLRVLMNKRSIYGLSHERHLYRILKTFETSESEGRASDASCTIPRSAPTRSGALPPEWTSPMTGLNRKLALLNLSRSRQDSDTRRDQAETYSRLLVESGVAKGQESGALPQSHFPLRLPSQIRDEMCDYLRGRGIDTGTLFPFPAGLRREQYPHTAEASAEVITLPLGPGITLKEVQKVSECVKDGLRALGM
jgi:dTDP-4-amino-4,6-dideoxygalactose transaminase